MEVLKVGLLDSALLLCHIHPPHTHTHTEARTYIKRP